MIEPSNPSKVEDPEPGCDGLHDESAPVIYLCTRCFPDLCGDLTEHEDEDEYRDDFSEME
jgi:hypothetical protein